MQGRRSQQLDLHPLDEEIERTIRTIRARNMVAPNEANPPRQLREYFTSSSYTYSPCIQAPPVEATQYEIKSSIIQMLSSFYGLSNKDLYKYLNEFLDIYSTMRFSNFPNEALRLKLFSFSLKDKAKHWLNSLDSLTITIWDHLQKEFLKKYFPIRKINQIRRAITNFSQLDGVLFHETWERLRDRICKCPHHAVPKWQLVQYFYDGLLEKYRQMVDSSCGETIMLKSEDEAW